MARYISFAVLLAIIIVIGVLFYKVMIGFFVPVFLAAVLVVVFRPLHRWVMAKVGNREHFAAAITTTLIVLIVLIPTALVLSMAAVQGASLFQNFNLSVKLGLEKLRSNSLLNLEFPYAKQVQEIQLNIDDIQKQLSSQTYEELTNKKGRLQSDVEKIRAGLNALEPMQFNAARNLLSKQIAKTRLKQVKENQPVEKVEPELEPYYDQAPIDVDELIQLRERLSDDDFKPVLELYRADTRRTESRLLSLVLSAKSPDELASIKSARDRYESVRSALFAKLSASERAKIESARNKLLQDGLEWHRAMEATKKPLDNLAASKETVDGDGPTMADLQRSVLELSKQWRETRETISGGPLMVVLKDFANPSEKDLEDLNANFLNYVRPRLVTFTTDSAVFLLRFAIASSILLLSLYFFLYDGPGIVRTLMELSPLDDKYELELLAEFDRISRAIVLATVLSAILQGLVAGIGYYVAGMPSLVLLTALTATCALVPFVGPAIVWAPVCVYLLIYEENPMAAGLLALWGLFVVGTVDNLVKVFVLHGQSQLHPLLALLSVLGGIQSLGPIGILVGPMVVVLLQTLLGILRTELTNFRKTEEPATDSPPSKGSEPSSLSDMIRKVKGSVSKEPTVEADLTPNSL
jgi:predicted PurR-regulated permease PerM